MIYIYVILLYIVYARNVYRYAIYMIDNIIILKYRKIFWWSLYKGMANNENHSFCRAIWLKWITSFCFAAVISWYCLSISVWPGNGKSLMTWYSFRRYIPCCVSSKLNHWTTECKRHKWLFLICYLFSFLRALWYFGYFVHFFVITQET